MRKPGEVKMRQTFNLILAALLFGSAAAFAQEATATRVFQSDLGNLTDQELMVLTVSYPPGVASVAHRHNAHTFVYVLEGSVQMQVQGGELETLVPGQDFYETPDDIHAVSLNASDTEPAKILVVFVKDKGAPTTVVE